MQVRSAQTCLLSVSRRLSVLELMKGFEKQFETLKCVLELMKGFEKQFERLKCVLEFMKGFE